MIAARLTGSGGDFHGSTTKSPGLPGSNLSNSILNTPKSPHAKIVSSSQESSRWD
jgi:hypothetical protein